MSKAIHELLKFEIKETKVAVGAEGFESLRSKEVTKQGVRIFKENRVSAASFVGEIKEADLLAEAEKQMESAMPAEVQPGSELELERDLRGACPVSESDFFEAALDFQDRLNRRLPNFVARGLLKRTELKTKYKNNLGAHAMAASTTLTWSTSFRRRGSPNSWDMFTEISSLTRLPGQQEIDFYGRLFDRWDTEVPLRPGVNRVLISPAGWDRNLGPNFRADSYHNGSALYSGKLGEKIFSDKLSLADAYELPEQGVFRPFDGEGVAAGVSHRTLVEKGVFKEIIYDLNEAKKYGAKSTGNGFREHDGGVQLGFSGLYFQAGQKSVSQLMEEQDELILVLMGFGGGIADAGEFSTPVQCAFLVKKGEVIGRLPQFSLNSRIQTMLGENLVDIAASGFSPSDLNPLLLMDLDAQAH